MKSPKAGDEQWYLLFLWQYCASEMPCTGYLENLTEGQKYKNMKTKEMKILFYS